MPRPRWTTRRMMAAVGALAVGLGLLIPAWGAACDPEVHPHSWIGSPRPISFPERYWRHLRGLPPPPCPLLKACPLLGADPGAT